MAAPLYLICYFGLGLLACSPLAVISPGLDFTLLAATAQPWRAGVPGGGSGTNYTFILQKNVAGKVQFDSVWVAGAQLPLSVKPRQQTTESRQPAQNDTITLLAAAYAAGPRTGKRREEGPNAAAPAKYPVALKGEALIRYTVNGVSRYYAVPQIETRGIVARP